MFGLNRKESKVFRFSLFGHGFVALGCAVFGFLPSCEEEEEEVHVFELASASPFPAPLPSVPVHQPPPPPPKEVKPPPPKEVKRPPPKEVKRQRLSIDQFRKDHKQPPLSTLKNPPSVRKIISKIDVEKYELPKIRVGTSLANSNPSVSPTELNQYLSRVQSKLNRVWQKMLISANLGNGGEAWLSFRISSNGTLLSAKLSRRSGNPALDNLVLMVVRTVGQVERPPGGKLDSTLEIPFVVN